MPCTRARSSHTRQRTSSYDEPSAARRPRRGRAHSSAPRGRRAPSLQSTLFIAAPQGHSGRNHSVWGTRAATCHRKRHPPSCVVDPPRASFRPAPLPTDLRPRILYRPPPRAGSYNLRSGSCVRISPHPGPRPPVPTATPTRSERVHVCVPERARLCAMCWCGLCDIAVAV